jgi:hypothetical protein
VEDEKQAAQLTMANHFRFIFQYLGWSDGRFFRDIVVSKMTRKTVNEENVADHLGKAKHTERKKLINEAWKKEVDFAVKNKDRTAPHRKALEGLRPKDKRKLEGNTQLMSFVEGMGGGDD